MNAIVPAVPADVQMVRAAITEAQRNVLTQSTPPEAIKVRPGKGGKQFRYVEQAWVNRVLNNAFNWDWSWEVRQYELIPSPVEPLEVVVWGRLSVRMGDGYISKEQFGTSDIKLSNGHPLSIGDDLKAASSDAMKKCASMLGVALDLYGGDDAMPGEPTLADLTEQFKALRKKLSDYGEKLDRLTASDVDTVEKIRAQIARHEKLLARHEPA